MPEGRVLVDDDEVRTADVDVAGRGRRGGRGERIALREGLVRDDHRVAAEAVEALRRLLQRPEREPLVRDGLRDPLDDAAVDVRVLRCGDREQAVGDRHVHVDLCRDAPAQEAVRVDPVLLDDDAVGVDAEVGVGPLTGLVLHEVAGEDRAAGAVHLARAAEHLAPLAADDRLRLHRLVQRDVDAQVAGREARRHREVQRLGAGALVGERAERALACGQQLAVLPRLDAARERTSHPRLLDRDVQVPAGAGLDAVIDAVRLRDVGDLEDVRRVHDLRAFAELFAVRPPAREGEAAEQHGDADGEDAQASSSRCRGGGRGPRRGAQRDRAVVRVAFRLARGLRFFFVVLAPTARVRVMSE